jgi:hypothetical protein
MVFAPWRNIHTRFKQPARQVQLEFPVGHDPGDRRERRILGGSRTPPKRSVAITLLHNSQRTRPTMTFPNHRRQTNTRMPATPWKSGALAPRYPSGFNAGFSPGGVPSAAPGARFLAALCAGSGHSPSQSKEGAPLFAVFREGWEPQTSISRFRFWHRVLPLPVILSEAKGFGRIPSRSRKISCPPVPPQPSQGVLAALPRSPSRPPNVRHRQLLLVIDFASLPQWF